MLKRGCVYCLRIATSSLVRHVQYLRAEARDTTCRTVTSSSLSVDATVTPVVHPVGNAAAMAANAPIGHQLEVLRLAPHYLTVSGTPLGLRHRVPREPSPPTDLYAPPSVCGFDLSCPLRP
jgi:hypothetical protein